MNASVTNPSAGRLYLWLGFGLTILGVLVYVAQVYAHQLSTPWYVPILATLGVLGVALSLERRRSFWRWGSLLLLVLVAGAEWTFMFATRLPAYSGPVAVGRPFPTFATIRADGTPFTNRDLVGDHNNLFVFFRGRW